MGKNSTSTTSTAKRRRTYTDEQRARNAEYLREYRRLHPDATRRWRDAYILRRAEKLRAQMDADAEMTEDAKIALMEVEAEDAKIEMMEAEAMGISKPIRWKPEVKGGADRG